MMLEQRVLTVVDSRKNTGIPKWAKSSETKPEVELWCRGRRLEKFICRHNSVADGPI